MRPTPRPTATALALLLIGGALSAQTLVHPKQQLLRARAQEPLKAELAQRFLSTQAFSLGLEGAEGFRLERKSSAPEGRTILRYTQTHQGARVFGSGAVVVVHSDNRAELLGRTVERGIRAEGGPRLGVGDARQASHRSLLPRGAYQAEPSVELVVFPTRYQGGLKPSIDPKAGPTWNREESVLAPRPTAAHVWAYEVTSHLRNAEDGVREMHVIVDARTGNVLRKWDAAPAFLPKGRGRAPMTYATLARAKEPMRFAAPPRTALRVNPSPAAAVAALGTGQGQYAADVPLAASANPGGGFDLVDPTRALTPLTWSSWPADILWTGITTAYWDNTSWDWPPVVPYTMDKLSGSPDNLWGDGGYYQAPPPDIDADGQAWEPAGGYHYADANGQTAAVDAHHAATTTYDMYLNVLGRLGLDGQDTGIVSVVHYRYQYDNAFWDTYYKAMFYGDGTYPFNPVGNRSLTSLDIGGHEMSHGVMSASANLDYVGEAGGLNEANSDMMSQAVVAYAKRAAGDPADQIPSVSLPWTLGAEINPDLGPARFLYKPSRDGISPDAWFHGMSMLDVHYSSGAANRMFFFLSQGASGNAANDDHSPYLPGGMTGIGLDAATRIWYKAMTEHFTSTSNYHDAREACLLAATDLYGATSAQFAAVENAFGAINVGAAHGQPERPLVTFPADLISPDSNLVTENRWNDIGDAFLRTPIVPAGETVRLHANVDHATDASVDWKAGIARWFWSPAGTPLDESAANGSFDLQGNYHTPIKAPMWCGVRAFSKQDPLAFGASLVFIARLDSDGDGEQDAIDEGMLALTWGLSGSAVDMISHAPDPEGIGYVDDYSIQMWGEGFTNAYTK